MHWLSPNPQKKEHGELIEPFIFTPLHSKAEKLPVMTSSSTGNWLKYMSCSWDRNHDYVDNTQTQAKVTRYVCVICNKKKVTTHISMNFRFKQKAIDVQSCTQISHLLAGKRQNELYTPLMQVGKQYAIINVIWTLSLVILGHTIH